MGRQRSSRGLGQGAAAAHHHRCQLLPLPACLLCSAGATLALPVLPLASARLRRLASQRHAPLPATGWAKLTGEDGDMGTLRKPQRPGSSSSGSSSSDGSSESSQQQGGAADRAAQGASAGPGSEAAAGAAGQTGPAGGKVRRRVLKLRGGRSGGSRGASSRGQQPGNASNEGSDSNSSSVDEQSSSRASAESSSDAREQASLSSSDDDGIVSSGRRGSSGAQRPSARRQRRMQQEQQQAQEQQEQQQPPGSSMGPDMLGARAPSGGSEAGLLRTYDFQSDEEMAAFISGVDKVGTAACLEPCGARRQGLVPGAPPSRLAAGPAASRPRQPVCSRSAASRLRCPCSRCCAPGPPRASPSLTPARARTPSPEVAHSESPNLSPEAKVSTCFRISQRSTTKSVGASAEPAREGGHGPGTGIGRHAGTRRARLPKSAAAGTVT